MRHFIAVAAVLCAGTLAGCGTGYILEMTPDGEGLRRSISLVSPNTGQPAGEQTRSEIAKPKTVVGRFVSSESDKIGGEGVYRHLTTSMGDMHIYSERFGGSDDLIDSLLPTLDAADDLIEAVDRWLAWQITAHPGRERLLAFVRDELRRDLRNVLVYFWLAQHADNRRGEEGMARVAAYLHERGYFDVDDLPAIFRAIQEFDAQGSASAHPVFALLQRFAARRMGVADDEPIPAALDFLSDSDRVNASLQAHRRHQIAQGELQPEADNDQDDESDPPTQVSVAAERVFDGMVSLNFSVAHLDATLAVKTEPVGTNGKWDAEAGQIVWSQLVLPDEKNMPALCWAVWADPDVAFQKLRFGKVVFQNDSLCQYVTWRKSLKASEAQQWDQFVTLLRPDDILVSRLTEFRFSSDPPRAAADSDEAQVKSYAATIIEDILAIVTDEE
jgi:hypothetical protein